MTLARKARLLEGAMAEPVWEPFVSLDHIIAEGKANALRWAELNAEWEPVPTPRTLDEYIAEGKRDAARWQQLQQEWAAPAALTTPALNGADGEF